MDKLETNGFVRLEWVRVEGELLPRRCADFKDVRKRDRPRAFCPGCNGQVILRIGERKRPHAAHKASSTCRYHEGDNALHENAKFHLAEQLRLTQTLWIRQHCNEPAPRNGECRRTRARKWLTGWNSVGVEKFIGTRRPDIVLFHNDAPIAAIEVYVQHAVDADKRKDLEDFGLPWIEVSAAAIIGHKKRADWRPGRPLQIRALGPEAGWRCGKCGSEPVVRSRAPQDFDPLYCLALERRDDMLDTAWEQLEASRATSLKPLGFCVTATPTDQSWKTETLLVVRKPSPGHDYRIISGRLGQEGLRLAPEAPLRSRAADALSACSVRYQNPEFCVPWTAAAMHLPESRQELLDWCTAFGLPRWWRRAWLKHGRTPRELTRLDLIRRVARHAAGGHELWSRPVESRPKPSACPEQLRWATMT